MSKEVKAALITGILGLVATIAAAIIGVGFGKDSEQKLIQSEINEVMGNAVNIIGDDNEVTINDLKDMVEDYQKTKKENESLIAQNAKYFEDLSEANNTIKDYENDANQQLKELQKQIDAMPSLEYQDLSLSIDIEDIPINRNNSMVMIDGREYVSKEIAEKLLSDSQNMTIKDDTLFIGKVVADKANLVDQYQMGISWCEIENSIADSFGNIYSNAIHFWHFQSGYVMYNLEEKYLNLKCKISGTSNSPMEGGSTVYIIADDNIIYSSPLVNKVTEPFEVDIPINNCKILKIRVDNNTAIISDAILYN